MNYQKADGGGDDEGAVTAEMGVGNVSPKDWSHPDGSSPVGDIVRGVDGALVKLIGQISNKIGEYAVVGRPLEHFVHYTNSFH